jgi:polar amino acid transport system substrate-binding protein
MIGGLQPLRLNTLLCCLALVLLTGCYVNPVTLPPPVRAPEPSGTLLKPEFRIGIAPHYPPLAFKFRGELVGVEVDFARQLGKDMNKQITFVETPWPELIPALVDGRIDIIMSGMSATEERAKLISFTESYMHIGQMALARAKDQGTYASVDRLFDTASRVGYVSNTTGEQVTKVLFLQAKLVPQRTVEDGVAALRKGSIDVFIHDAPTIWRIGGNPGETQLIGLYWPLSEEPLAWAVRKSDVPLQFALSQQLKDWKLSGRLQQLMSRWISLRITTI